MRFRLLMLGGLMACSMLFAVETAKSPMNEPSQKEKEMDNLSITSDTSDYDMDKKTVTFTGHVVAKTSEYQMTAHKAVVYLDKDNKIEHIEAEGSVDFRVFKTQESAKGDKCYCDVKAKTVTLTGNCVLQKDGQTARGTKAVIDNTTKHFKLVGRPTIEMKFEKKSDAIKELGPSDNKKKE